MVLRKGLDLIIISVLLFCGSIRKSSAANIYQPNSLTILLVGITADELADQERQILVGKKLIEIPRSNDWQQSIRESNADEIVLKQNTGFVGLYTPSGILVKPIESKEGNPYFQDQQLPPNVQQSGYYSEFNRVGLPTGGRIDPYKPTTVYRDTQDGSKIAAGYGYNPQVDQPKIYKQSTLMNLLNFTPIDMVTPFNYPGTFDQMSIHAAYGLGVIPHIGGAIAQWRRAKAEHENYEYYKHQYPPSYVDAPPTIYQPYGSNKADPAGLMSQSDLIIMQPMPQSMQNQMPSYANPVLQY